MVRVEEMFRISLEKSQKRRNSKKRDRRILYFLLALAEIILLATFVLYVFGL